MLSKHNLSWSAYNAELETNFPRPCASSALLPLFSEKSNSVSMLHHAMNVTKKAICHLNGQAPVITIFKSVPHQGFSVKFGHQQWVMQLYTPSHQTEYT